MSLQSSFGFFYFWAVTAVILSAVLEARDREAFDRFFFSFSPPLVIVVVASSGAIAIHSLAANDWMGHTTDSGLRGIGLAVIAALGFACLAVGADYTIGFSEDMNVQWSSSLLFYPSIAFVAEVVFHLVPLALLTRLLGWVGAGGAGGAADHQIFIVIGVVAMIEVTFQTVAAARGPHPSVGLFVAPHLFAIGVFELVIFRRYGFVSMAAFRLVYYLLWHVTWGEVRHRVLF